MFLRSLVVMSFKRGRLALVSIVVVIVLAVAVAVGMRVEVFVSLENGAVCREYRVMGVTVRSVCEETGFSELLDGGVSVAKDEPRVLVMMYQALEAGGMGDERFSELNRWPGEWREEGLDDEEMRVRARGYLNSIRRVEGSDGVYAGKVLNRLNAFVQGMDAGERGDPSLRGSEGEFYDFFAELALYGYKAEWDAQLESFSLVSMKWSSGTLAEREWVLLGTVEGTEMCGDVMYALAREGIAARGGGSVVFSVKVDVALAREAVQVLQGRPELKVEFFEGVEERYGR